MDKKAYLHLVYTWAVVFVILAGVFMAGGIWIALTTSLAIFILFVLPGFSLLYKKDFLERLIFGFMISLPLIGIPAYYLGLLGLHIKYGIIFSVIITLIGIGLDFMDKPVQDTPRLR